MASDSRATRAELELKAAKEAAEAAERRSAFLAEASAILSASLDYEATLASLARLAVPRVADDCVLFEVEERRVSRRIAVAHVDPEKESLLERLSEVHFSSPEPPRMLEEVVSTGRPRLDPRVSAESPAGPLGEELREIYARLGRRSSLILPLVARGQTLGVLFLATSDSGRVYGPADLALGEELARRAAVAVDNARLFGEVRAANDAKDQFLATLSHELRTPLTPVLALVSGLEGDDRMRAVADRLAMIRRNVELEARLIDDLLDLTRIARGRLELHRGITDVQAVVEHAIEICCAEPAQAGRLRVVSDLSAAEHRVWGDGPRMMQIFWNLLRNAVKFTPDGGTIHVRSWNAGPSDGVELVVEVTDTGMGIEPSTIPLIFTAFEQGQSPVSRKLGGLGLGLSISKAIAELHGGRITAVSQGYGRGATFRVHLPAGRWPAEAKPTPPPLPALPVAQPGPVPRITRQLRLLLVEDHPDTAEAMAELLRALGHEVQVAGSVAAGLAAAAATLEAGESIDLVISDLGLPDGSGMDLMRELVSRYGLRGIALSGYGTEDDVRRSLEAGFTRHLTKPVNFQALEAVILEAADAGQA